MPSRSRSPCWAGLVMLIRLRCSRILLAPGAELWPTVRWVGRSTVAGTTRTLRNAGCRDGAPTWGPGCSHRATQGTACRLGLRLKPGSPLLGRELHLWLAELPGGTVVTPGGTPCQRQRPVGASAVQLLLVPAVRV